jgi:hypothetical protein
MAEQTIGHWEGDTWVEASGYRVARKWVENYPALFGPLAKDPDEGQGEVECDDMIARLLAKFTGYGGTFSNWTERHGFIIFSGIGYNDVQSSDDVPPIPEFFCKEMAYCYTGLSMGRGAKKLEEAASKTNWTPVIIAIIGGLTAGTAYGQTILNIFKGIL